MKRSVSFLHTSPAAIPPLMQYYTAQAPDLEITNALDDGLLRLFSSGDYRRAESRLREMLATARDLYRAEAVMITCSAVPRDLMQRLRAEARIPVLKIDDPMADQAVRTGRRIGVLVTFQPTLEPTTRLLEAAAQEAGAAVDLVPEVIPEAYEALLSGNTARHDALLIEGIERLAGQSVDVLVLAQVSMARILPQVESRLAVPVLSSLPTSLNALRRLLAQESPGPFTSGGWIPAPPDAAG